MTEATSPPIVRQPDENGILSAYRLDGRGNGELLGPDPDLASEVEGGFRWVHLQCDASGAVAWMRKRGLDEDVIEALSALESRPRSLPIDGGVMVVLRGVNTNPGADPEDMVSVRLWFTDKLVVSARRKDRKLLSIEDLRGLIQRGQGPRTTGEFVDMLADRVAYRIGLVVDQIEETLTEYEEALSAADLNEFRKSLSLTRRQTAAIRRYLAPQRDALDTLFRMRGILSDDEAYSLRVHADRMTRYVEDLDLARERTMVLQEELQNRVAGEQNARLYILSLVAAIFLPLSFLTGVFGMNVGGLPGLDNPQAFIYLSIGMGVLAVFLIFLFRWSKWL